MGEVDPLNAAREVLFGYLPRDRILESYSAAGGQELVSGRFASPESSAALVANTFGYFLDQPERLTLPCPSLAAGDARTVQLEAQMRFPWRGGLHPWLDVAIETDTALIGVESKRYEPFRDRKTVTFSQAYSRPVWGEAMAPFEAMRDALLGGRTFQFLDAAQLVKHAFGLRTQAQRSGKRAVLCYLYAEPKAFPGGRLIATSDIADHRDELAAFSADVSSVVAEVQFCSLSYGDLLRHWADQADLQDHAAALTARFDL